MDTKSAVDALSALAQETRLAVFRRLVQGGADGVAAGELARSLGVVANTMSAHLGVLAHAGLIRSRRAGRSIVYTADYDRMSELLTHLVQDCCNGSPEVCAPLFTLVRDVACCAADLPQPLEESA